MKILILLILAVFLSRAEDAPKLTEVQKSAIVSADADLQDARETLRAALDVQAALKAVQAKKAALSKALSVCSSQSVTQDEKGDLACVVVPEKK